MTGWLLKFLMAFLLLAGGQVTEKGKVVAVKDGDTIDVLLNGKTQRVRFAHIDCPEKNQPYGTKARQFTSLACFGQTVSLVHTRQYDRNKRLLAEVITATGKNLNKELVKAGLAWHFKKYSTDTTYANLETASRKAKNGLWKDLFPVAPWNWRKR